MHRFLFALGFLSWAGGARCEKLELGSWRRLPGSKLLLASLVALAACTTLRHPVDGDLPVYEAVIANLAAAGFIDGMEVSAWFEHDRVHRCDAEDRAFLANLPLSSRELADNYCSAQDIAGSFSGAQQRKLSPNVPAREDASGDLRGLRFSYVGYDSSGNVALVYLVRQVAESCDVGEYFVLKRDHSGWVVEQQVLRWIS